MQLLRINSILIPLNSLFIELLLLLVVVVVVVAVIVVSFSIHLFEFRFVVYELNKLCQTNYQ